MRPKASREVCWLVGEAKGGAGRGLIAEIKQHCEVFDFISARERAKRDRFWLGGEAKRGAGRSRTAELKYELRRATAAVAPPSLTYR